MYVYIHSISRRRRGRGRRDNDNARVYNIPRVRTAAVWACGFGFGMTHGQRSLRYVTRVCVRAARFPRPGRPRTDGSSAVSLKKLPGNRYRGKTIGGHE